MDGSVYLLRDLRKPATGFSRTCFGGFSVRNQQLGFLVETRELCGVAAFGHGVGRQVAESLLLSPATCHREITVGITRGDYARQNPTCLVQRLLD